MMDLGTIRRLSSDAGRRAKRNRVRPWHPEAFADINLRYMQEHSVIPFLGDYVPKGWEKTDVEWFVDMSGFGSPSEPALTIERFVECLKEHFATHPTAGYALTEQGQFQGYVSAYEYTGLLSKKPAVK